MAAKKTRSPAQKAASKKLAARNKAAYRALDAKKGKKNPGKKAKAKGNPGKRRKRSSKKGTALVPLVVGTGVGAGMAVGTTALIKTATNAMGWKLPQIVDKGGPLVGLVAVWGASKLAPAIKPLVKPAAIGTLAVLLLNWYVRSKAKNGAGKYGSGQYNQLRGSGGNVASVVSPGVAGSGSNVARVVA